MSITLSSRWSVKQILPWLVLGLGLTLVAANTLHDTLFHGRGAQSSPAPVEAPPPSAPGPAAATITLPEGKFREAKIATAPVELVTLPAEIGVPGRIEANPDRQVEVRPRAAGIVRDGPRRARAEGQEGRPCSSPSTAPTSAPPGSTSAPSSASWPRRGSRPTGRTQIAENVAALIPELRKGVAAAVLEKKYADRQLGSYRATLLQAYAEFEIASHEEEKTSGLFNDRDRRRAPVLRGPAHPRGRPGEVRGGRSSRSGSTPPAEAAGRPAGPARPRPT